MTQRNRTIAIVGGVILVILLILGIALIASSGDDGDDPPSTDAPATSEADAGESEDVGDENEEAGDGETVVALIDDAEVTLKTLRRKATAISLEPANPTMQPIVLAAAMRGRSANWYGGTRTRCTRWRCGWSQTDISPTTWRRIRSSGRGAPSVDSVAMRSSRPGSTASP